ncbi:MAG: hypothetical protein HWE21_10965 [Cytophagia bacterium]|nr:hypothetical protein [Cytophagia bacterium]
MKYIRIILALIIYGGIICHNPIQAQEFTFMPSVSIPVGEYSSQDLENGGFAKTGVGFHFMSKARSENWPDWLSVNFQLSQQINKIDGQALAQAFNAELGGGVLTAVSGSRYKPLMIGLGPVFSKNISGWLKYNITSSFGIMYANFDPLKIKVFDDQRVLLLEQEYFFTTKPSFSYSLGAEMVGSISQKIDLVLSGMFMNSNVDVSTTDQLNSSQSTSSINFGLGINYKF